MRVLKFDAQAREVLQALGFTIAADKQTAVLVGEVTIDIIRPVGTEFEFWLSLTLPDGAKLECGTSRHDLLKAAPPTRRIQSDA
jgi:hypothetical protein